MANYPKSNLPNIDPRRIYLFNNLVPNLKYKFLSHLQILLISVQKLKYCNILI